MSRIFRHILGTMLGILKTSISDNGENTLKERDFAPHLAVRFVYRYTVEVLLS